MPRDINLARDEARFMLDAIHTPDEHLTLEQRQTIARKTVENFRDHINKGFLSYRKSVTQAEDFAFAEWYGQGSVMTDVLGREFIDILGGFGLYSPGIRHPKSWLRSKPSWIDRRSTARKCLTPCAYPAGPGHRHADTWGYPERILRQQRYRLWTEP